MAQDRSPIGLRSEDPIGATLGKHNNSPPINETPLFKRCYAKTQTNFENYDPTMLVGVSMSWLFWNVRGLRNQSTVQELAKLVRAQDISVVFLAETWVDEVRLKQLCDDLRFDEKWAVNRITRVKGLALLWKNYVEIDMDSSSPNLY